MGGKRLGELSSYPPCDRRPNLRSSIGASGVPAHHKRGVTSSVDRLGLGESHGAESPAVVAPLDNDDVLLAGGVTSELDGSLDGLGTRVPHCGMV